MNKKQDFLICASVPVAAAITLAALNPGGALGQTVLGLLGAVKPLIIALWGLVVAVFGLLMPLLRIVLVAVSALAVGGLVRANRKAVSGASGINATVCGAVSAACAAAVAWGLITPLLMLGAGLACLGYVGATRIYNTKPPEQFVWDIPVSALILCGLGLLNVMLLGMVEEHRRSTHMREAAPTSHLLAPAEAAALDEEFRLEIGGNARNAAIQRWTLTQGRTAPVLRHGDGVLVIPVPNVKDPVTCTKQGNRVDIGFHKDTTYKTDDYLRRLCAARASEY